MPLHQIALISETSQLPLAEAATISAALQKQVTQHFGPIWNITATVDVFPSLGKMPPGYWPIFIRDDIDDRAAGNHISSDGHPFALVRYSFDDTSLICSHECLEMLADPFGNEFITAESPDPAQGLVYFLLEVCDPCEAPANGYFINNVLVSDFYTPRYFDQVTSQGVQYSFFNQLTEPKQVLPGGYLSWRLPATGEWWQARFFGDNVQIESRGHLKRPPNQSWREVIDQHTKEPLASIKAANAVKFAAPPTSRAKTKRLATTTGWAARLKRDVGRVIAKSKT